MTVHSPQQKTSNQCENTSPRANDGNTNKNGLNSNQGILESPKWSVGEPNFPDRFSKNVFFPHNGQYTSKTESPLRPFGESIGRFWRVHFLSGKIENCGFLPCISDADRFAVFRGVHPCLHVSVFLFQIKMTKLKHKSFVLGNLVPVRGAAPWHSVCELQRAHLLFRDVQHTESGIAGCLNPVNVNLFWEV